MAEGGRAEDTGPNQNAALDQYRQAAPTYDRHMRRFARCQRMAIERLELQPGETVIDVACGTASRFRRSRQLSAPLGTLSASSSAQRWSRRLAIV